MCLQLPAPKKNNALLLVVQGLRLDQTHIVCVAHGRTWLTGRGALAGARGADRALLGDLEGSLLAALLLALQRLAPLLTGTARNEPRAALRTALAQVRYLRLPFSPPSYANPLVSDETKSVLWYDRSMAVLASGCITASLFLAPSCCSGRPNTAGT